MAGTLPTVIGPVKRSPVHFSVAREATWQAAQATNAGREGIPSSPATFTSACLWRHHSQEWGGEHEDFRFPEDERPPRGGEQFPVGGVHGSGRMCKLRRIRGHRFRLVPFEVHGELECLSHAMR
jgi:hypothetical protein